LPLTANRPALCPCRPARCPAAAKTKLRWGLTLGGILLVCCLLMLAANAGLTYAVVSMSRETQVLSTGTLMDRSGQVVVGERAKAR